MGAVTAQLDMKPKDIEKGKAYVNRDAGTTSRTVPGYMFTNVLAARMLNICSTSHG